MNFIPMTKREELRLQVIYKKACDAYKNSDAGRWEAARWCAKVVGTYSRGGTIGLADEMSVSPDTIENMAHAYVMFIEFCSKIRYRKATRMTKEMPRVYYSHFRALYDARHRYNLSLEETFDILRDVYLQEGALSSREIDKHVRERYGKVRDWMDYAEQVQKKLANALKCPDLPKEGREIFSNTFNWIGNNVKGDK